MSATESPAHFSRLGRWKSSLTQKFQRTKIQVSLVPRCIPLLLSIDLAVGETIGFTNIVYKKSGQGFQICDYRSLHIFPNSNNTKSKQQEAALNPKRGNSYEYKKRVSQTFTLRKLSLLKKNGGYLLSHGCAVPSARAGLTALFGMGRGGTPPL